jgi:hypothetical protein
MKRCWPAVVVNLFIPGAGLIVLRREWLGLALSVLFGVLSQLSIFGALIVPADIPRWVTWLSGAGALSTWALAQWLVRERVHFVSSPGLERELRTLCGRAREAIARKDWADANRVLRVATDLDDEDVEPILLWAELTTATGRVAEARRWWELLLRMDRSPDHREQALAALASLGEGAMAGGHAP